MSKLVKPHGSEVLKPLLLAGNTLGESLLRARNLKSLTVTSREMGDLVMLGIGGFTPLTGFMNHADWLGVCNEMKTSDGLFWPIPITLSSTDSFANSVRVNEEISLADPLTGQPLAIMTVTEKYKINRERECLSVFKTTDESHPGVKLVMAQGAVNLAGPVKVLSTGYFDSEFGKLFQTPAQTRALFKSRKWSTVAAFQTRNPMHRSHEYLAKIAIEVCDGVLIHSLLGSVKPGDIPAPIRAAAIDKLLDLYFVPQTVIHSGYPLDMRYAGPREALLHALFRQNYGCSHLLVGRDHAGVGDFYGPFDAHRIFDELSPKDLLTQPIKIDWTFWCYRCDGMSSARTCQCDPSHRLLLSGTKLRRLLSEREEVPDKFSRPEVLAILRSYYEQLDDQENIKVELKGHSAR